jgi:hypothetical protein
MLMDGGDGNINRLKNALSAPTAELRGTNF